MTSQLKVSVFGGLGSMASPMARHWCPDGLTRVVRIHDRNAPGVEREQRRKVWRQHGAIPASTVAEVLAPSDLDGVFVCCGKNGDDLALIAHIANVLATKSKRQFLCHMSTVTTGFVAAAHEFCAALGVDYVNYPLTGGPSGAEKGTMLILASGSSVVYERLFPSLSKIGIPKYFGESAVAGAEVKLMGQAMVFNGLVGICTAAALHAECFQSGMIGGEEQGEFFDFLNQGAGGTRQWEVALSRGVRGAVWDAGFSVSYAAIDAIYAAKLCLERRISAVAIRALLNSALTFSFILNTHREDFATHSIVREMVAQRSGELDSFITRYSDMQIPNSFESLVASIDRCISSLPDSLQPKVTLSISAADFFEHQHG